MFIGSVALVGYMGSGKTTVGRALAQRLKLPGVDLDEVLVQQYGPIPRQISRDGIDTFRARERLAALALCDGLPRVLSTGGGTLLDPDVRQALIALYTVVWLDVPFKVLQSRVGPSSDRPLWDGNAYSRFLERQSLYECAHYRIDGNRPVDEVVADIAARCA